jgi:serine/threonine-protein kinase
LPADPDKQQDSRTNQLAGRTFSVDKDPTSSGARPDSFGASTLDLSGRCVGSSYILVRPLGQGATGTVWRGVDRASGEPVAVKLLHDSLLRQPKLVTRFVQERTILLMLRHRNVVRVRDLFSVGESLALVMDLVPGGSLRDHLRRHHTVAPGEAARLAAQVAAALAEAHELGIVHRDLKPDNILLHLQDGQLDTRLTDFGIARVLNTPALTTPNAVVGTPHYMSPEAFHGAAASPAADVYALGVLLYELVSGRPPYDGDSVPDLMRRHLEGRPERRPGIPDELWDVILSCLEHKPRLRPTAAELVAELSDVARATADVPALPGPGPEEPAAPAEPPPPAGPRPVRSIVPAPRAPRRRFNQPPSRRWARPWAMVALIAGTMAASGVATAAWHLGRSGSGTDDVTVASGTVAVPLPLPSASASVAPKPAAPKPPAPARDVRTEDPIPATTSRVGRPAARAARPASPAPRVEARPYGPRECVRKLDFDFRNPSVAEPCHSVGADVQISGGLTAPDGGRAAITVALQEDGRTVAGPYTCPGLVFTGDGMSTRECGPKRAAVRRGHRYTVLMTWTYSRDGRSRTGEARGSTFAF